MLTIIPAHDSVQKFLKDIEEQYDNKLGLELEIEKLQVEINKHSQEDARVRTQLLILPGCPVSNRTSTKRSR